MSLESMLAGLEQEAEAEKKKILDETSRQLETLLEESELKAKKMREELLTKAKTTMDFEEAKAIGVASAQASKILLEARSKELERCFSEAREKIYNLVKDPDYPQLLFEMIQESLVGITGKVTVEVSPQDVKPAQEILKRLKREVEVKANPRVRGGVVIHSQDSRLSVDNSFDSRLSKVMATLTTEIAQKLWPPKSLESRGNRSE